MGPEQPASGQVETSELLAVLQGHPELVTIVEAWPRLPEHIRAAIGALYESGRKG